MTESTSISLQQRDQILISGSLAPIVILAWLGVSAAIVMAPRSRSKQTLLS